MIGQEIARSRPAVASATRTRRAGGKDPGREKNGYYKTPASSTRALLRVETLPHRIWEPACGDGAISRVLEADGHDVLSTDLVDRGYGQGGRDFLLEHRPTDRAIFTNPPWELCDEFALAAMRLGAPKVCLLMRLAWLEGQDRLQTLWGPHPPVRVWVFSARQTLWRGDEERPEDSNGGAIALAWYVWERGYSGAPALGWLPPEPEPAAKKKRRTAALPDLFAEVAS